MPPSATVPRLEFVVPAIWQNLINGWKTFTIDIPISSDNLHRRLSWALRLRHRALGPLRNTGIRAAGEIFAMNDEILELREQIHLRFHANLCRGERCNTCGLWRKKHLKVVLPKPEVDPVREFLLQVRRDHGYKSSSRSRIPLVA